MFRKLHNARVIHKDLKGSNILVESILENEETPFKVYLIDFENIVVDPVMFERFRVKNLAQLHKSFPSLSIVTPSDRLFFLKHYLGVKKLDRNSKRLVLKIERMTKKIFKRKGLDFHYSKKRV